MINVPKQVQVEGSVIVTFRGAEGSEVAVECPKVMTNVKFAGVVEGVTRHARTALLLHASCTV